MNYTVLFCIIATLFCILLLVIKLREANIHKALNMPKRTTHFIDSSDQASDIGRFLYNRALFNGISLAQASSQCGIDCQDYYRISTGKEPGVLQLIRMCHLAGCEIVIRQIGTSDIEQSGNDPQVFAEKIIRMRE